MALILSTFSFPNQVKAAGTTYYVSNCGTVGNDANNGTDPSTPWLTIAKVNASSFNPGDSVLFNKGCTWREQLTVPSSGSSGNPITFGSYGTGAMPVIDGADVVPSWTPALTVQDVVGSTAFGGTAFLSNTNFKWLGGAWIPSANYTLTQACVALNAGTGSAFVNPVTGYIYSDNSGSPGSSLGTALTTIQPTLTATPTYYCFNFTGVAVSSGTQYWVVITGTVDGANFGNWKGQGTTGNHQKRSSNGTSWNVSNANNEYVFNTYSAAATNIWQANVSTAPNVVIINGTLGVHVSSFGALTAPGQWYYTGTTLYTYSLTDPGTTIEAGSRNSAVDTNGNNYLAVNNLDLKGSNGLDVSGAGLWINGGSNVTASGDTFELAASFGAKITSATNIIISQCAAKNIAGDSGFTRGDGINESGSSPSTNITISDCNLSGYFDRQGIAFENGSGITITGNTIIYGGPWAAIDLEPGAGYTVSNVSISFNNITLAAPPSPPAVNPLPTGAVSAASAAAGSHVGIISMHGNTIDLGGLAADGIVYNCDLGTGTDNLIDNNVISNLSLTSTAITEESVAGVVQNNEITGPGFRGISIQSPSGNPAFSAIVKNNQITGLFGTALLFRSNSILTATISQNLVQGATLGNTPPSSGQGIVLAIPTAGSILTVFGNLITGYLADLQVSFNTAAATINLYNNTLVGWTNGLYLQSGETAAVTFTNNIVSWTGTSASAVQFINSTLTSPGTIMGDHNLYYAPNDPNATWMLGGVSKMTMSDWGILSGMDTHSIQSNPLLTNPSGGDFTLQPTSPAIDAGVSLGSPYNLGLNPTSVWPSSVTTLDQSQNGSGYDIGAYVFPNLITPAPTPTVTPQAGNGAPVGLITVSQTPQQYWTLLQQQASSTPVSVSFPSTSPTQAVPLTPSVQPTFTHDLSFGTTGTDVEQLQHYLNTHGYLVSDEPPGPGSLNHETLYFGPATRAAVIKFQQANDITPSVGYFGPLTRAWVEAHQ